MKIDYKAIGQRVKYHRSALGLKQDELSEMAGVEPSTISHIETGTTKVSLPTLINIANSLMVSLDELVYENLKKNRHVSVKVIYELLDDCDDKEIEVLCELIKTSKYVIKKAKLSNE